MVAILVPVIPIRVLAHRLTVCGKRNGLPFPGLIKHIFLVAWLIQNPHHGVLFNVISKGYFWPEERKCYGLGKEVDTPLVHMEEEDSAIVAIPVFVADVVDVGEI